MATQREIERNIVKRAQARGMTQDQIREAILKYRSSLSSSEEVTQKEETQKPSALKQFTGAFKGLGKAIGERVGVVKESVEDIKTAETPAESSRAKRSFALRTVGQTIGGIGDILGRTILGGVQAATPDQVEEDVKEKVTKALETPAGQAGLEAATRGVVAYQKWKEKNRDLALDVESALNIASILPVGKGVQLTGRGVRGAARKIDDVAGAVTTAAREAGEQAPTTGLRALTAQQPTILAREAGEQVKTFLQRAPERASVKVQEIGRRRAALEALPEQARRAADEGVKLRDINLIESANTQERALFTQMLDEADAFALDRASKDPAETVGGVFRERIDNLEKLRVEEGKKLGEVAKTLDSVDVDDAIDNVVDRMAETPGLDGIKVTLGDDGVQMLDFSETTLAGQLSKKDRAMINAAFTDIFDEAGQIKDGLALHRLRQEIWNNLHGRKAARIELSSTQEDALEAIRRGLMDTLESNNNYRELSRNYAQIQEPLRQIRRAYRNIEGADGDILDAKAAMLARRLTSNAVSASDIRSYLRQIDSILADYGQEVPIDVERAQDFYNALSRYYDISKDTSLAGQVDLTAGDMGARSLLSKAIQNVKDAAGSNALTRQKAFEDYVKNFSQ